MSPLPAKLLCKAGLGTLLLRPSAGLPVILMYHGVSDLPRRGLVDWSGKHVPLQLFKDQMTMLRARRRVVPLSELIEKLRRNEDARGMLAITFDDGYLDNLECAASVLAEQGMSATFFLASGFIGRERWAWTDRLEAALDAAAPAEAYIAVLGATVRLNGIASRAQLLGRIKAELKKLPWQAAEEQVLAIEQELGVRSGHPIGIYRFMDWDGARRLVAQGFDVGAHTVNHAILTRVDITEARREIEESRARILAETGACSPTFCYPNGKFSDFNEAVVEVCRDSFSSALAAEYGAARSTELFRLRRVPVDGSTSVARLASLIAQSP